MITVGPGKDGAILEGRFMTNMVYWDIPIPRIKEDIWFLLSSIPYVLKADGLAAGKGVLITSELEEDSAGTKMQVGKSQSE